MKPDIGSMGESRFRELCGKSGIAANGSYKKDLYGWDFIVELPFERDKQFSVDQQSPAIECKVQVKSTINKKKSVQVKLSTLHRLVTYTSPVFFAFFKYDKRKNLENVYFLHLDETLMAKILKKVREHDVEGQAGQLNKIRMTINYNDSHWLGSIDDICLKATIESYIPKGLTSYIQWKSSLLDNLGYKRRKYGMTVNVTSESGDVRENLVDLFLGLREEVAVSGIQGFSNRFGIKIPASLLSYDGSMKMSLPNLKPSTQGSLFFKSDEYSFPVKFDANIYFPDKHIINDFSQIKVRLSTDYFEMVIAKDKTKITFKWPGDDKINIEDLWRYIWLFSEFESKEGVFISANINGGKIDCGYVAVPALPTPDRLYSKFLLILEDALDICRKYQIPVSQVMVVGSNLQCFQSQIRQLRTLSYASPRDMRLLVNIINDDEAFSKAALVYGDELNIGNVYIRYTFAFLIIQEGPVVDDGSRMACSPEEIRFGDISIEQEESSFDLGLAIIQLAENLKSEGYQISCNAYP